MQTVQVLLERLTILSTFNDIGTFWVIIFEFTHNPFLYCHFVSVITHNTLRTPFLSFLKPWVLNYLGRLGLLYFSLAHIVWWFPRMELEECVAPPYNLIPFPLSCVQCWGGKEGSSYSLVLPHGSGVISKVGVFVVRMTRSRYNLPKGCVLSCSYCLI